MKKSNKHYLILLVLFFSILFFFQDSFATDDMDFLSLKKDEVNLRQGPSFEYPIKLIYKKKYLPIKVLDKLETWVKVIDFENNSGWIHISQLSRKKSAINIKDNSIIYKKQTIYSKPIAKLESGRLVLIKKCAESWCKVSSGGFNGWIKKNSLWGKVR